MKGFVVLLLVTMGIMVAAADRFDRSDPMPKHHIRDAISNFIVSNRDSFDNMEAQQQLVNFADVLKKSFSIVH